MILYLMNRGIHNEYIFGFRTEEDMIKLYRYFNKDVGLSIHNGGLFLIVGINEKLTKDSFYDIDDNILFSMNDVSDNYNEGSIGLWLEFKGK